MPSFLNVFNRKKSKSQELSHTSSATQSAPTPIPYALPNNPHEINRLDFQHYMLRYVLEANYLAPLAPEQVNTILDVGCGTGRWIYEMAQQFPHSRLVGIDHVLPDTKLHFPLTCTFQQYNVLNGLPFPNNQFDYVHQRLLVLALPLARWPFVLQELVRVTRPGGWIELVESDGIFTHVGSPGTANAQLFEWGHNTLKPRGIDSLQVRNIPTMLETLPVENISTHPISVPTGRWAGRVGQMSLTNTQAALLGMKPLICAANTVSEEDFDRVLSQAFLEFEEHKSSLQFTITYAQKRAKRG